MQTTIGGLGVQGHSECTSIVGLLKKELYSDFQNGLKKV